MRPNFSRSMSDEKTEAEWPQRGTKRHKKEGRSKSFIFVPLCGHSVSLDGTQEALHFALGVDVASLPRNLDSLSQDGARLRDAVQSHERLTRLQERRHIRIRRG